MLGYQRRQHLLVSRFKPVFLLSFLIILGTVALTYSTTPSSTQKAKAEDNSKADNTKAKDNAKAGDNTKKEDNTKAKDNTKSKDNTNVKDNTNADDNTIKGHLRPFGESGSRAEIEVRSDFPEPYDFIVNYVQKSKPVKLSGVVSDARATRMWTDDYLLSLDLPDDSLVSLETQKKENRSLGKEDLHFHEFLKIYNQTEHYMVDDVPSYLRPDVWVPCSLQCPELIQQGFAFAIMWFSSGGTKSVVHTDAFENILCLYRGQKTFVMLDPDTDREKIDLDSHQAYSKMDVDR
ncbi:jmjC domain-containing protein E-like [Littorina saxatilis]|uniref:jmjC domain-containing protein E-like n=1 Tax=Littorina saxatilis TaxID=31220 RepID=UPI0038B4BD42